MSYRPQPQGAHSLTRDTNSCVVSFEPGLRELYLETLALSSALAFPGALLGNKGQQCEGDVVPSPGSLQSWEGEAACTRTHRGSCGKASLGGQHA